MADVEGELDRLRLAAIVAIDVAGYSVRAAADEVQAISDLTALRQEVEAVCARIGGRLFNTAGDSFMLEFITASAAVEAAERLLASAPLPVRIGVHLGEVHVSPSGDLLGHGVNAAARLEAAAAPASVLVSAEIRRALGEDVAKRLVSRGAIRVSPNARPIQAFGFEGAAPPPAHRRRAVVIGAGLAAVASVAAVSILAWPKPAPARPQTVALAPFQASGTAPAIGALARAVSSELAGKVANDGVKIIGPDGPHAHGADLVIGGQVESSGPDLRLTIELEDGPSKAMLWSTGLTGPADRPGALEDQAAAKLADVLHCALDAANFPHGRMATGTLQLYLRACDLDHDDGAYDRVRELYRAVAEQQPGFSRPWSRLAYATALSAFPMPPDQARAARQEARAAAHRALAINPQDGLAYEALADAGLGELSWAQIYDLFKRGLAAEPNNPKLIMDESQMLLRMGRIDDATQLARRGVATEPFSPDQYTTLVTALLANRRVGEARAVLDRARRIWPDNDELKGERIGLEARQGDVGMARRWMHDAAMRPSNWTDAERTSMERLIRARLGGAPERSAYVRAELDDFQAGRLPADAVMMNLANVGASEEVFRVGATVPSNARRSTPGASADAEVLWRGFMADARRDRRFIALADRFGVVEFWRTTGMWPDYCAIPSLPYDCRKAVASAGQR